MNESTGLTDKTRENGIGVWDFDDIDLVMARTEQEAREWYQRESGFSAKDMAHITVRRVDDLDEAMVQDGWDEAKRTFRSGHITLREAVRRCLAEHDALPGLVASCDY